MTLNIVTTIIEDIKQVIVAELPDYAELDFVYNINKNPWNTSKKRWGVTPIQLTETTGVTTNYTVNQRFRIVLTDEYTLVMSGDSSRRSKVNALMDKAHEIYTAYVNTRNIQISLNVSNLSFLEPQFIEQSHVAIVTFEFDIKYRNPLSPKYTTFVFTDLGDVPQTYAGEGGKVATVKDDESGLEFTSIGELTGLTIDINTAAPLQGGALETDSFNLSIGQAGASSDGYLSSTDWNTFNNKQPAGDYALNSSLDIYAEKVLLDGYQPSGDYALNSTLANYAEKTLLDGYQVAGDYQPAGDYALASQLDGYQPVGDYALNSSLDAYAEKTLLDGYQVAGDYALNSSLANYAEKTLLDGYQVAGDYALASQLDGYQPAGDYALNSSLANYAEKTLLDGYQPAGDYQPSGDYALNSTLDGYALKTDLDGYQAAGDYALASQLDGYQPAGDYALNSTLDGYALKTDLDGYQAAGDYALKTDLDGYQVAGDYVIESTTISTSAPLSGGGDLSTNRTLSISQAGATSDGYVTSTDWNTFNNKQPALGFTPANSTLTISTTSPLSGGGDLSANRTISIPQSNSTTSGYLSATDWGTFNSKQNALGYTPVNRAGDVMTGNLDLGSFKITSLANGTSPTDAVNYSQLTSIATGLNWQNPVLDPDLVDDTLASPPVSPVTSATYIIGTPASGAWTGCAGRVVWWDGTNWIDVSTGNVLNSGAGTSVAIGDRFLVASATSGLGGLVSGGLTGQQYKLAVVTNATPGTYAYTFTAPSNAWALSVNGVGSNHISSSFTYSSSVGSWINFSGPSQVGIGDGLIQVGNTINVKYDNSTIATNGSNQLYVKAGGITNTQINASAAIAYSKLALTNSIVNADIASAAAIAYSKLNLTSSILTGDLASGFILPSINGGTGVNNAGSLTYGSNNITLTTSGPTNVTLPTSGTLLANSRAVNTSSPLSGGGDLSADRTLSISQASASSDGYLSSTDWSTFNSKQSALGFTPANTTTTISTTSPLSGGGDLSTNRTLSISQASSTVSGYLSSTDWSTFNSKQNALTLGNLTESTSSILTITGGTGAVVGSGTTIEVKQASGSQSGFLSSTDWTTFNNKEAAITAGTTAQYWRGDKSWQTLNTTAVTEGTNLYFTNTRARDALSNSAPITYSSGNIGITQATTTTDGYLSSTDWNTFNNKQPAGNYILNGGNTTGADVAVGTNDNFNLALETNGTTRLTVGTTSITSTLPLLGSDGLATAPSYSFSADSDTGMWRSGDNTLNFATNGTNRVTIGTGAVLSALVIQGIAGTQTAPSFSFSGDPDTGMYNSSANVLSFATAGTTRFNISGNQLRGGLGDASGPIYTFNADADTGIYSGGADIIAFTAGGVNKANLSTTALALLGGQNLTLAGATSGTLTISPAATIIDHTLVLPSAQGGADTYLKNDGAGNLTWSTVTAGVSSVTASAPLSSSGGATPNITISQANTSTNGYLSSTDWNTFNNKQSALTLGNLTESTSSVLTITGGTGAIVGSGLTIEVKQASGSQSGFLSSTDWTTFNNKSSYSDPLTTRGDLLYRNSSNVTARLPLGANTYVLTSNGTDVTWAAPTGGGGGISGSGTTNTLTKWTSSSAVGNSSITDDGTSVSLAAGVALQVTGDLQVRGTGVGRNVLLFFDNDNSNFTAFRAAANVTADVIYTLPAADGSTGQVLSTNGAASLAWISVGNILNGGNSFASNMIIGTNDNNSLLLETNGTARLTISTTAITAEETVALVASNTTESTSSTTGAVRTSGGIAAAKNIVAGGQIASEMHDAANSGAAAAINWNNGNVQELNISENTTITFSNPISGATYILIMIQDGGFTRNWGTTIKWAGGVEPTWSTIAGRVDVATFLFANGVWYGGADTAFS